MNDEYTGTPQQSAYLIGHFLLWFGSLGATMGALWVWWL